jgi:[protein-PII] uridylyltransferase
VHASTLRDARDALVGATELRGTAFGRALTELLDTTLGTQLEELRGSVSVPVALVALGSYARGELCPGSDIDLLLVHAQARKPALRDEVRRAAERIWYPLWDASFVTGHAARTVKQTLALADQDLDALTALLRTRHVAGATELTEELAATSRKLAERRRERLLRELARGAEERRARPGPVAEMLEPDLKEGAGGLRDLHALDWAGCALGVGEVAGLARLGYLTADDLVRLDAARERLLDLRVALHRATGSHSDRLLLQEQDAVAVLVAAPDADVMVRELATSRPARSHGSRATPGHGCWPGSRARAAGSPRAIACWPRASCSASGA